MNEEIVDLLVRLTCGEAAEPPLRGTVAPHGERFRVWKHGERRRVESADGELHSIREPERSLAFPVGGGVPVESAPGALDYDEEDEPWVLLRRPELGELDLRERRLDGTVVRGHRFGRETATFTLPEPEDEECGLTYVLDVTTGMPIEIVEDGEEILRWHELEVLDAIDPQLLSWDGEVTASGWVAYVGVGPDGEVTSDGPIPEGARRRLGEIARRDAEIQHQLDLHDLSAVVPLKLSVDTGDPDTVSLSFMSRGFLSVWGTPVPDPEETNESSWTTADGWTWTSDSDGIDDPRLLATVRERITQWRDSVTP